MNSTVNRRSFLRSSVGMGMAAFALPTYGRETVLHDRLRVLSIGVVGTQGRADRRAVDAHPEAEIVGLCDVDANYLAQASAEHPNAFTCRDYREAFTKYVDRFDAVIIAVPDHMHAPILLTAMAHDKHVYGQKPLVQQLEELVMVERALKAKPHLVTQLGNQRMAGPGRRAAVEILKKGKLGKAIEAYVWAGSPNDSMYFNYRKIHQKAESAPAHLDWDLWLGVCPEMPYYENLAPAKWRSWWEFGTNGLGDWGCHLLDIIFLGYDELVTPVSVKTECAKPADEFFHADPCKSTVVYEVKSDRFAGTAFPIHQFDSDQMPTSQQLRIPEGVKLTSNMTAIVCEGGTLVIEAEGRPKIYRNGVVEEGLRMEGMPTKWEQINHWHAWVDNCLGVKTELYTPFKTAIRITEAALLAVKATRYPGQELRWNKSKLEFTNHPEATKTIIRREYRKGFAPPTFA